MSARGKKLTDILHDNHTQLGQLLHKVFQLRELEDILKHYLDDGYLVHTKLGSYQNGKLTLLTESGSWATKLKYQIPDLLSKLRQHPTLAGLRNIEIKVAPHLCTPLEDPKPKVIETGEISQTTKSMLQQSAESLSDDPLSAQLKAALLRLSK